MNDTEVGVALRTGEYLLLDPSSSMMGTIPVMETAYTCIIHTYIRSYIPYSVIF